MANEHEPSLTEQRIEPGANRTLLLAKNALANLVRALSSSAVTVLLPLCLVLVFRPADYAGWALVFSLGAFVLYFDLGIPTTVQAMVGRAISREDLATARRVTISGAKVVALISVFCLTAALGVSAAFDSLFPAVPDAVAGSARIALILIVAGQTSGLLGNCISGYFAGQQKSHVPALVLTPARLTSMGAALIAALVTNNLVWTAVWYAIPVLLGTCVLFILFFADSKRDGSRQVGRDTESSVLGVVRYSGPLAIWGISALVTSGLGVVLVARFDYQSVVPYSIAAVFVAALAGAQSSITAPWLPELARTRELVGLQKVSSQTDLLSRINAAFLFFCAAGILSVAPWLLPVLLKQTSDDSVGLAWVMLAFLLLGSATHLAGTVVSLAFIATRTHSRVIFPPVVEALATLGISVAAGSLFGAVGVALGALIGGVVGIVLCFTWSIRTSGALRIPTARLIVGSWLVPLLAILPALGLSGLIVGTASAREWFALPVVALGFACSCYLIWKLALPAMVRERVRSKLRARGEEPTDAPVVEG